MRSNPLVSRAFRYGIVDAFSPNPYSGNPAAVVWVDSEILASDMQRIAAEFNLSETAFIQSTNQSHQYSLRWFTPRIEVKLCGHATLGAVVYLCDALGLVSDTFEFDTLSGRLGAFRNGRDITLDFPAVPLVPMSMVVDWVPVLGCVPDETFVAGDDFVLVFSESQLVRDMTPNMGAIAEMSCRCVIVTAPGDDRYTCISRVFAPGVGISEDPVTGSAHCALSVYWQQRLGLDEIVAFQASHRTGEMRARWQGDRVWLTGQGHLVAKGEVFI
ncbi:PhzF family phenazine biosynthesis isomerase [bacterium]|nr:PhzF family phenazine biosynthesis isomerase [bacterium]